MKNEKDIEIKVDHNFHLMNENKMKEWESRRGNKYIEYRKEWYNNPIINKLNQYPIHLDIEATSACNFECTMCPRTEMIENKKFWKIQNFNLDLYKKIIDDGVKKNLRSIKLQYLGEPLVNKKLVEMIKYAKEKGVVDVMFNTNASLLNEKKSIEIIKSGVDKVFFSFDSPYRERFNKIRVKGDFDEVLNNIKNFMRLKKELKSDKPITRVQMVLMKENKKEWNDFVKLFENIVDTIAYVDYLDHGNQKNHKNRGLVDLSSNKKPFCCPQLWQRMFIHPDGVVTPCCIDSNRELNLGNVNEKNIDEIWNGKEYNQLRKKHLDGKIHQISTCNNCPLAKY